MTIEIDLPPIDDIYIDILFKRYWNFYIIQNTASVKQHREKILNFLGEQYKKEIELQEKYDYEVSFTYILFDQKPTAFIYHDIHELWETFDCSIETKLSAGMETLAVLVRKQLEEKSLNTDEKAKSTMWNISFIGDGNDFMEDKSELLKLISENYFGVSNHRISFHTPDMQFIGYGNEKDPNIQAFFQIKQPTFDWGGLMQSNLELIRIAEEKERLERALKEKPKTREQLLEEIKEYWLHQPQESLIRFEVKDDYVLVHGYAELENRKGYPVGDGIVFFCGERESHHELYIANTITCKIRHLSTAGGTLLVDDDEIDFDTIEQECKHGKHNARLKTIKYAGINRWGMFKNGVCAISWMLYPEGIYFADSDGFGGTESYEENVYGIMDTNLQFIEPFRPIDDIDKHLLKIREK